MPLMDTTVWRMDEVLNECVYYCCECGHAKDPNCLRPTDQAVRSGKAFPWAEGVDDR